MNSNPYQLSRLHLLPPRPQSDCSVREPQSYPPVALPAGPSTMLALILGTSPAPRPSWDPPASPHMPRSPRCPGGGMLLAPPSLPPPPRPRCSHGVPTPASGLTQRGPAVSLLSWDRQTPEGHAGLGPPAQHLAQNHMYCVPAGLRRRHTGRAPPKSFGAPHPC